MVSTRKTCGHSLALELLPTNLCARSSTRSIPTTCHVISYSTLEDSIARPSGEPRCCLAPVLRLTSWGFCSVQKFVMLLAGDEILIRHFNSDTSLNIVWRVLLSLFLFAACISKCCIFFDWLPRCAPRCRIYQARSENICCSDITKFFWIYRAIVFVLHPISHFFSKLFIHVFVSASQLHLSFFRSCLSTCLFLLQHTLCEHVCFFFAGFSRPKQSANDQIWSLYF